MPKKIKKLKERQKPRIWPPRDEHQDFATPLNPGERRVLDLLEDSLCHPQWNIFVQPKLLNKQPDFLIFARHCQDEELCIGDNHQTSTQHKGVTIIEVKDWTPETFRSNNGCIEVRTENGWERTPHDPLGQVHEYRRLLSDRFIEYPKINSKQSFANTRGCVILPRIPQGEAESLLRGGTSLDRENRRWIQICGKECFSEKNSGYIKQLIYGGQAPGEGYGDQGRAIDRLWRRIAEPEIISDQRRPLELSEQARGLIRTPVKARRVRGAAGSGKTAMLAAHAARLAAEGKKCIILTYNLTLSHYIQDLVKREARALIRSGEAKDPDRSCSRVDCIHFHEFLKALGMVYPAGENFEDYKINRIISDWIAKGTPPQTVRYDAIFVDEGQDFEHLWWDMLRKLCQKKPEETIEQGGSHMTLAVDKAQDIYERKTWVDEAHMEGCGFRGGYWAELLGSYRLPADMIPIARTYGELYLNLSDPQLPKHPEKEQTLSMFPTRRAWINLGPEADQHRIVQEATQQIRILAEEKLLPPGDICFLTLSHEIGKEIEDKLDAEGIRSETVFDPDKEEQRHLKKAFWAGTNVIKGCTVHSFKGWEARHLVIIHQNQGEDDKRPSSMEAMQLYIAITRVKGLPDRRSSSITVINTVPEAEDFKATFEG